MFRFILRMFGYWLVAAATVVVVVDGARSIGASALMTTSVAETLAQVSSGSGTAQPVVWTAPWLLDIPLQWLLAAPSAAVLAIPGIALLILGAKKRPPSLSREFAA